MSSSQQMNNMIPCTHGAHKTFRTTAMTALHRFSAAMLMAMTALPAGAFELRITDIAADGTLPDGAVLNGFGCSGANRSPALAWTDPPAGTRSLALTMYDPDAPTGSGFWHWIVLGLPPTAGTLAEGAGDGEAPRLPKGAVMARTDYGQRGFGGACPPKGDPPHRYVLSLHALDVADLGAPLDVSGAVAGFFLNAHTIATATAVATYGR
jgi:Raf kinase inhibitor-like YbhB/YbcL family protein